MHKAIIAIDPGPKESAVVFYDAQHERPIRDAAYLANEALRQLLTSNLPEWSTAHLVIEQIASYGMPVGAEVFETVFWAGRFAEAWGGEFTMLPRLAVKMHLCHDSRAKDPNIRQALLDRFGKPGTKKAPGLTYGLSGDMWAALAVAVTCADQRAQHPEPALALVP